MGKFTVRDIMLQGPYCVQRLLEFSLSAKVNEHAVMKYVGIVDSTTAVNTLEHTASGSKMKVSIGGKLVFNGPVLTAAVHEENGLFYFSVACEDNSHFIDLDKHCRSFQNIHMMYADMLEQVFAEANSASIITIQGTDIEIGTPLLQYKETDWTYSLRMAGKLGTVVVPNLVSQNAQVAFGMPQGDKYDLATTEYLVERRGIHYIRKTHDYPDSRYTDFLQYSTKDDRIFNLGDKINIYGNELSIVELSLQLKNGMLENTYLLGSERAFCVPLHFNLKQAGLCLEGKVLATRDEVLKLHLDIDPKQEIGTAFEFEYSPQTNNGMYCMPQIGTKAMLRWRTAKDGDAVAIHCVRTNGKTCGELQDYHERYFTTEFKKRLAMLPDVLYFTGGTNAVKEKDNAGIQASTKKKLLIRATDTIYIHSLKKVIFDTPQQFKATKTGVMSGIDVSGGQIHMKSNNVIVHGDLSKPKVSSPPIVKMKSVKIKAKLAATTAGLVPTYGATN